MRFNAMSVLGPLMSAALVLSGGGCSSLKWRVTGPVDGQAPLVGPLRIDVEPVDTAEFEKGHSGSCGEF